MDLDAARQQAVDQRLLDGRRIEAKIVTRHDRRSDAQLMKQRAEAEPQRLHAHEIDLGLKQPARIIFAKARRLDERLRFVGVGVALQRRFRRWEHDAAGSNPVAGA